MTAGSNSMRLLFAGNLFEENDVLLLPSDEKGAELAAVSVVAQVPYGRRPGNIARACLVEMVALVSAALPRNQLWFYACFSGPDNRITRHRGFSAIPELPEVITARAPDTEVLTVSDAGVLHGYAAFRLNDMELRAVMSVVEQSSQSFLASLPEGVAPNVAGVVSAGWTHSRVVSEDLARRAAVVTSQQGVLFRLFGGFDDREVCADALMCPDVYAFVRRAIVGSVP